MYCQEALLEQRNTLPNTNFLTCCVMFYMLTTTLQICWHVCTHKSDFSALWMDLWLHDTFLNHLLLYLQRDHEGHEVINGLPGHRGLPGPQVPNHPYERLPCFFHYRCNISCFLLSHIFQGPPGIAGLPVSTTEDVMCCFNAVESNCFTEKTKKDLLL